MNSSYKQSYTKIKISQLSNVSCRMCNKAPESVPHVLSGCSVLAQNKYLARHNNALKVLYFELLRDLQLVESLPAWYSPIKPKPEYVSEDIQALWELPTYGENHELQQLLWRNHMANKNELIWSANQLYNVYKHQCVTPSVYGPLIGNFSNDDGNGNENVISKHKFALL